MYNKRLSFGRQVEWYRGNCLVFVSLLGDEDFFIVTEAAGYAGGYGLGTGLSSLMVWHFG